MAREKTLLFSLVSVRTPVASAVAVRLAPPLFAVHVPLIGTVTVPPAGTAPVVPFSVVLSTWRRVTVEELTAVVPRLFTDTVKVTAAPTAGLDGLEEMPVTWRSGPGLWATTSFEAAVRLLLLLSCSTTVSVGSTTAETEYVPIGRLPALTGTVAEAPAASAPTEALPTTWPSRLTSTVVAGAAAEPALRTVAFTVTASLSEGRRATRSGRRGSGPGWVRPCRPPGPRRPGRREHRCWRRTSVARRRTAR